MSQHSLSKRSDIYIAHDSGILMTVHQCRGAVMRTLEIADADVMRLAIQQEIARSDESRYD